MKHKQLLDDMFDMWFKDYGFEWPKEENPIMYGNMRAAFVWGFLTGKQEGRNE